MRTERATTREAAPLNFAATDIGREVWPVDGRGWFFPQPASNRPIKRYEEAPINRLANSRRFSRFDNNIFNFIANNRLLIAVQVFRLRFATVVAIESPWTTPESAKMTIKSFQLPATPTNSCTEYSPSLRGVARPHNPFLLHRMEDNLINPNRIIQHCKTVVFRWDPSPSLLAKQQSPLATTTVAARGNFNQKGICAAGEGVRADSSPTNHPPTRSPRRKPTWAI